MIAILALSSCSSEEKATSSSIENFKFTKTTEMLAFESALKEWMQVKRETTISVESKTAASNEIEKRQKIF